jgi:hypothetical protein
MCEVGETKYELNGRMEERRKKRSRNRKKGGRMFDVCLVAV